MIELSPKACTTVTTKNVFFLIRGRIELLTIVSKAIKDADRTASDVKYHLMLVPRGSLIAETELQELGVYGSFDSILDLPIVFPLDSDLLTLDMTGGLYEYVVTGEMSLVYDVASSLMHLQSIYGTIPVIRGIGSAAQVVVDLMHKLRHEKHGDSVSSSTRMGEISNLMTTSSNSSGELNDSPIDGLLPGHKIDSVLLIDRRVDLVTPFLSQATYEGLIDEFFGIRHNSVKLPGEKFTQENNKNNSSQKVTDSSPSVGIKKSSNEIFTHQLSSAEELYSKLRDLNFKSVGPFLLATSKRLSSVRTETNQAKSVKELKAIVDKLPYFTVAKKSTSTHIAIAELVKEKFENIFYQDLLSLEKDLLNLEINEKEVPLIESLIYSGSSEDDLIQILRLICLQSQTTGIRKGTLEFYKKELIDTFGTSLVTVLYYLEQSGLIRTGNSIPATNLLSPSGQPRRNTSPSLANIFGNSGRDSVASNSSNGNSNNPFSPITQSAYAVANAVTSVAVASGNTYSLLKKCLNLTDANYGERTNIGEASTSISSRQLYSIYSGYIPLSTKLVEMSFKAGWSNGSQEALRILAPNHITFEQHQYSNSNTNFNQHELSQTGGVTFSPVSNYSNNRGLNVPHVLQRRGSNSSMANSSPGASVASSVTGHSALASPTGVTGSSEETKVVLVVFIGGCTLSEVSGLRLLSQVEESNVEFITLTTKIFTANTFLKSYTSSCILSSQLLKDS